MTPGERPDPQPDPYDEPGENLDGHLLPDLARLRTMTRRRRHELVRLVADWEGPLVETFRQRVQGLDR